MLLDRRVKQDCGVVVFDDTSSNNLILDALETPTKDVVSVLQLPSLGEVDDPVDSEGRFYLLAYEAVA